MVKILTLFVGLVVGSHSVQLAVSGPVARVELRLNGTVVASADGAPWELRVDFGGELHPGQLEALALDSEGHVLARDVQWINLPAERATATLVPDLDAAGRVVGAWLRWESPEFPRPRAVRLALDGEALDVRPPHRINLEAVDQERVHVLSAEILFPDDIAVRRELVFGKGFAGDTSSGLTALPVVLEDIDALPPAAELEGWFDSGAQPLRVAAVEAGDAVLVVVVDPAATTQLEHLLQERGNRRRARRPPPDSVGRGVAVRVLLPEPVTPVDRSRPTLLFPYTARPAPAARGLLETVVAAGREPVIGAGRMLGDGVAMAGLRAGEGNRPRTVLLLLGGEAEDVSRVRPEAARRFLSELRVPLVVWDLSGPKVAPQPGWRPDREVVTLEDLDGGVRRLRHELEAQRIVWVSGRHLPRELELGPAARGIRLAE